MGKIQYYTISLGLLLISLGRVGAQQIISNSGGTLQNTSGTLSFTLGEIVIDTKTNTNGIITQGFHQTKLTITAINDLPNDNINIVAYPNPTTNAVFIKVENGNSKKFSYLLFDTNGKLLLKNSVKLSEVEISFETLTPAVYFLKIISDGKEIQTLKIVKK